MLWLTAFSVLPAFSQGHYCCGALRSGGGSRALPEAVGVHPSGLGWEAAGGAAWDVQSDGQLLQLVQAVAGAGQVGWSPPPDAVPGEGEGGRAALRLFCLCAWTSFSRPLGML